MIIEFVERWNNKKHLLEKKLRELNGEYFEYSFLVKLLINEVINDESNPYGENFDTSKMTIIDDGDYQGTQIFIIPKDVYQPSVKDYIMTNTYYGSCSGCDTLQGIIEYNYENFSDKQIKELMDLCLHLLQKIKYLTSEED